MQNKWFPKIGIKENWKVVLLSIIGAATFWFFNALNKNYDARISYPLNFSFARDSVIVVEPLAEDVKIDVTSGGWNLLRKTFWLNATPVDINLDNPSDVKYLTRASLIPIISDQLDGLKLNYVVTDTVFISIEDKIVKKLKVQVDSMRLPLQDGYRVISNIDIEPDSATIIGPKSIMNIMNLYVWTEFRNSAIDSDFDDEVKLMLPNRNLVTSNPEEVNVTFEVEEFVNASMDVNLEALNFPEDSSAYLADSTITLLYVVSKRLVNTIATTDFHVSADFSMLNRRDSTVVPILNYAHDDALEVILETESLKVIYAGK